MLVDQVGNAYAASSLLGLTAVLDAVEVGSRVLLVSFGSGAGSDAVSLVVTDAIGVRRALAPTTHWYVERRREIDYALYARYRGKLAV
jgi:hydroxymethylglutaryl-CoA synthase